MSRDSAALREKRMEIAELEASKAFWGDGYEAMHQALLDDLAELSETPTHTEPTPEEPMAAKNKPIKELLPEKAEKRRAYNREWYAKHAAPAKAAPKAKEPPPPRETSLDRPLEAAIDLGRAIERHVAAPAKLDDVQTHIRGIRRQVWSLLADLENLSPAQLVQLQAEVALLDSASATAYQMVSKAVA